MSLILRQSTAAVVSFGPFVDKGDGVALEIGLVSALDHASTGIMLSKNGGALTIRHATVTATTYDAYGNYRVTLDATDTNTIGTLRMQFSEAATCLPVWQDFIVVDEAVYDALFGTTALATATNITAGTLTTVTNLTNLPAITANWLTATGIAADAITAAKIAADVTTELQSGLATAANLATVAGYLDTEIAAILADTNEIQTDWANGGRLDLILDARASQASVDDLPTNAELATALGTADDAMLAAIPSAASIATAVLTTQMTESYAANGVAPTLAQAQFAIHQYLMGFAIGGTTYAVKKLDTTTGAFDVTLDDATSPTSALRS